MTISNVIICGLGALGLTYADRLKDSCILKILANSERVEKYKKNPPIFNGEKKEFDYLLPDQNFDADLIIITTKSTGLDDAVKYIKNFVSNDTIIISLINGISSEEIISRTYPCAKVLHSFFIGHSAMGIIDNGEKKYYQDGVGKIVFEHNSDLVEFFKKNKIDYQIVKDIIYSQWLKLGVNIILNQLSAINVCTVGELRKMDDYLDFSMKILGEVKQVAKACGVKNVDNYESEVLKSANLIADDGKTSMYQDVVSNKKTEVDIFSGEILRLGKIYGIKTPYNQDIYNKIKNIERKFL